MKEALNRRQIVRPGWAVGRQNRAVVSSKSEQGRVVGRRRRPLSLSPAALWDVGDGSDVGGG